MPANLKLAVPYALLYSCLPSHYRKKNGMNLNDLLSNDRRSFNGEEVPLHFFYTKKASCLRFQIYGK